MRACAGEIFKSLLQRVYYRHEKHPEYLHISTPVYRHPLVATRNLVVTDMKRRTMSSGTSTVRTSVSFQAKGLGFTGFSLARRTVCLRIGLASD